MFVFFPFLGVNLKTDYCYFFRFGLTVNSAPTDEESKKKARLTKFSSVSQTDKLEEEKKKARAIRFRFL